MAYQTLPIVRNWPFALFKCRPECTPDVGVEALRHGGIRRYSIKAVPASGRHMKLRRYARGNQTARIFYVCVYEEVDRTDGDVGRRQAGQVNGTGGYGADGDIFASRRNTQHRRPAIAIVLAGPDELSGRMVLRRRAIVEHGVDEKLKQDGRAAGIADMQGQRGRVAAACAVSSNGDPHPVYTELGCVLMQPRQRSQNVLACSRPAGLWREAVAGCNNDAAAIVGHLAQSCEIEVWPAADEAAAVNVEEGGCRRVQLSGRENENADVRGSASSRHEPFGDVYTGTNRRLRRIPRSQRRKQLIIDMLRRHRIQRS